LSGTDDEEEEDEDAEESICTSFFLRKQKGNKMKMNESARTESNKFVLVHVSGGLGNQAFQIGAGLTFAKRHGRECVLVECDKSPSEILGHRSFYWKTLFRSLKVTSKNAVPQRAVHICKQNPEQPLTSMDEHSIVDLQGTFQHLVHLDLDFVVPQLFLEEDVKKAKQDLKWFVDDKKWSQEVSITQLAFLHVRRGDYKKATYFHLIMPNSYYEMAVSQFPNDTKFIVFCEEEDLKQVQADFDKSKILKRSIVDYIDTHVPDYVQLLMMANFARGGIISNGTFAYWSGIIHDHYRLSTQSIFVAPKPWFVSQPRPQIIPSRWVNIDYVDALAKSFFTFHLYDESETEKDREEWRSYLKQKVKMGDAIPGTGWSSKLRNIVTLSQVLKTFT
jgi:hypothetical protein